MDADYGRILDHNGAPMHAFEPSLFVWAMVMSRPTERADWRPPQLLGELC